MEVLAGTRLARENSASWGQPPHSNTHTVVQVNSSESAILRVNNTNRQANTSKDPTTTGGLT